jgi:hypothetical protein
MCPKNWTTSFMQSITKYLKIIYFELSGAIKFRIKI